jgi:membrane-associated phospholipid phosphatase
MEPDRRSLVPDGGARWMWLLAVLLGAFVVALGVVVARVHTLLWVDRVFNDLLYIHYIGTGLTLNSAVIHSATAMVVIGAVSVLGCLLAGTPRGAALFGLAPTIAIGASEVLKHLIVRPVGAPIQGYPSGHETGAVALAAAALVVLRPGGPLSDRLGQRWRIVGSAIAVLTPIALGAALIALRWHLPTDVFGGAALGVAAVAAVAPVIDFLATRPPWVRRSAPPADRSQVNGLGEW